MNRRSLVLCAAALSAAGVDECSPTPLPPLDVAAAHAPIHFQDTDSSCTKCDWLTAIDYDGNFVGTDNWDRLFTPNEWGPGVATGYGAVVYTSTVETCTHWFVIYAMFHPRDWDDGTVDQEHENDMEGALAVIRKDGTPTGTLEGMITVFHHDFYSYVPDTSPWTDGDEDIDGTLSMAAFDGGLHPMTSQEAKGHGMKAWPFAGDFAGNPGEDGVRYVPGTTAGVPVVGGTADVPYQLVPLSAAVWPLQLGNFDPYATWGKLAGDESGSCGDGITLTCSEDAANMPWSWDDTGTVVGGDGLAPGLLALDPAYLVDRYFDGLGAFSLAYVSNQYLEDLRQQGYNDAFTPAGFPSGESLDALYGKLDAVCP